MKEVSYFHVVRQNSSFLATRKGRKNLHSSASSSSTDRIQRHFTMFVMLIADLQRVMNDLRVICFTSYKAAVNVR